MGAPVQESCKYQIHRSWITGSLAGSLAGPTPGSCQSREQLVSLVEACRAKKKKREEEEGRREQKERGLRTHPQVTGESHRLRKAV